MAAILPAFIPVAFSDSRIHNGGSPLKSRLALHSKESLRIYRWSRSKSFEPKNDSFSSCFRQRDGQSSRRLLVLAITKGSAKSSEVDETIPSWARPDSEEPPPWARGESNGSTSQKSFEAPFYVYLLASAIAAIAAIGSIFEYINERPVFGVVKSDSIFYAPLLGFFVFAGIPMSAFLWFKSVQVANKDAEEQDRRDGYL